MKTDSDKTDPNRSAGHPRPSISTLVRCLLAGVLMGLANLVPGISGGTMLVAAGVYRRFIDAVSDVSRLRFRVDALLVLAAVCLGAALAIAAGSGVISVALTESRWAAYSLFIGLTMGGAPVLWKMLRPIDGRAMVALVVGFAAMLAIVLVQSDDAGSSGAAAGGFLLALAGAAAASAMILPGVSGAYLLLLLGAYETIINSIKDTVKAAASMDVSGVLGQMGVIIPVGIGVLVGVVGVSNLLRVVLHRYEKATIAFLLGLLLAAPAGLYPFVDGVPPQPGETIKGQLVTEDNVDEFEPKDWRNERFAPTAGHLAGASGLFVLGLAMTLGIARLGGSERDRQ
jgi:putative membrane protein